MIESLISDLAFILLLGAVVTLLFKWIKPPPAGGAGVYRGRVPC